MMDKPFAITLDPGSSLANHTGSWRTMKPVYLDRLPPCNTGCPAGENIQGWLFHAESGDYEKAWRVLTLDNPLPAIMGRVCYHPCEGACNRGLLDSAVGINSVERFLGDKVEEALQEGIMIKWLSTIKYADVHNLTLEKMKLDDNGFPQPTGEFESVEADSPMLALGQDVDLSLLEGVSDLEIKDGVVQVDSNMMTGHPGIFAGGDMVPSERTVTTGVGHGKKAARRIDAWLNGKPHEPAATHEPVTFDMLNPWYYSDAPKTMRPMLDAIRRQTNFDEVRGGLSETNALFEARRCLSCGNCFECDNCYGMCPDNAVIKLGPGKRFLFNYDYCKGCGICFAECPCGAIKMVAEDI